MKKVFFSFILITLSFSVLAQKKNSGKKPAGKKAIAIDSSLALDRTLLKNGILQARDEVNGTLTAKDKVASQNGQKTYYDSYSINLKAGEELFIEHFSNSFRVMLGFKKPDPKETTEFSYDSNPFSGASFNKFHYVAPKSGVYTLLATSMDAQQTGTYRLVKTITTPKAIEASLDPEFASKFKALTDLKKNNFKDIYGDKIKKDKKDKAVGIERYLAKFELISGKNAQIVVDNGGQTANFKTTLFESENQEDVQNYFEKIKKQLQVLTRNWVEQPAAVNSFSASTDKDFITLNISTIEPSKKKKQSWQVGFIYN
ncbi:hypothetical protein SAMN04515674_105157 [Pseudarcicella hirudinis]|uniref:Pre-peptidase C-terminal domain-containing protein n=1 Tax=Pseudarcicella hirudinis TaxID=1079859 RepID=A0A1I5SQS9_9BACT|nr:hypothetical protein [Pseudarcicella hirudinis]SFP73065.1 hypothetical protein SAMN04515674_105157 [Pseudarcicella hirudinis]